MQALFGLRTELELTTGNRYSFSAAIFYLGFIIGAYPAMALVQRYPVERVASAIVFVWGLCLILTTVCQDYKGLYAQRFFLGFLESGISPMFMLIVGSFYKKGEQAMRMGYVFVSIFGTEKELKLRQHMVFMHWIRVMHIAFEQLCLG